LRRYAPPPAVFLCFLYVFGTCGAQAASERSKRPWIIVNGHRPIYTPDFVNPDGSPSGEAHNLQLAIEDLMHQYGVDIYFAGHKHSYQRTYPVYNNIVSESYTDPKYTVHFIVGGAGCDEMQGKTVEVGKDDPAWMAAKNTADYGMGILRVKSVSDVKSGLWLL
jgi:Calcineurin-like phosphoesterase/Iron/zinc purple acid phosphatase-like protein C